MTWLSEGCLTAPVDDSCIQRVQHQVPGATGSLPLVCLCDLLGGQPDRSHKNFTAPSLAPRNEVCAPAHWTLLQWLTCVEVPKMHQGCMSGGTQVRSSGSCLIEASVSYSGGCLGYRQCPPKTIALLLQDDIIPWTATEPTTTLYGRYAIAYTSNGDPVLSASCVATTPNCLVPLDCGSHPLLSGSWVQN